MNGKKILTLMQNKRKFVNALFFAINCCCQLLLFCIKHCGYDKSAMMKQRQKNYFKKRLILIYLRHLSVHLVKKTQHRPRERRQRTANTWLPFLREQIRDLKVWAKGVLVALFIKHVSGSNITFTKRKKNTKANTSLA